MLCYEPVQLFPDDSQLPDLGLSGDSNLWQDGYSYRQNDRENNRNSRKGYTNNKQFHRIESNRIVFFIAESHSTNTARGSNFADR